MTVQALKNRRVRLILVDEAGTLQQAEIRGLVAVHDQALDEGFPLTVVFIGMDDIGDKIAALPQIKGRVQAWCPFQPYQPAQTLAFLRLMSPHFAAADPTEDEVNEQVQFVHEACGGVPGRLAIFARHFETWRSTLTTKGGELMLMRAVEDHLRKSEEAVRSNGRSPHPGQRALPPTMKAPTVQRSNRARRNEVNHG